MIDLCVLVVFVLTMSLICLVFVVGQESVVKSMGDRVDEDTLQSVTLADELTTNLTTLNVLLEGNFRSAKATLLCLFEYCPPPL